MRAVALVGALVCACGGEEATSGVNEPIRVHDVLLKEDARFKLGTLPGSRALGTTEIAAGAKPSSPSITSLPAQSGVTAAGATGKIFTGRASRTAAAVGVKLRNVGAGYFLVPVGAREPLDNDDLDFSITVDFGEDVPTGNQHLLFVAFDGKGHAGTQFDQPLCIAPAIPDNLNKCRNTIAPPALVVSLAWDAPVDLDLVVVTPEGKLVDPKHPTTARAEADGGVPTPLPKGAGVLDRDSFAGCAADGHRREDLVFQEKPPRGHYLVYANLFDSCGQPAVGFELSFHAARAGKAAGTYGVDETYRTSGELRAEQENGGAGRGLYVTEFDSK